MTKTAKDIYLSYLEQLNLFKNWAIQTISSKLGNNDTIQQNKKRYVEGCACAGAALKIEIQDRKPQKFIFMLHKMTLISDVHFVISKGSR